MLDDDLDDIHPLFAGAPATTGFKKLRKRIVRNAREAIEQGGTDRFDTIFDAITRSGALDHTLECARQEAQAAAAAISSFPDSIYKESLLELCSYSTTRQS